MTSSESDNEKGKLTLTSLEDVGVCLMDWLSKLNIGRRYYGAVAPPRPREIMTLRSLIGGL